MLKVVINDKLTKADREVIFHCFTNKAIKMFQNHI